MHAFSKFTCMILSVINFLNSCDVWWLHTLRIKHLCCSHYNHKIFILKFFFIPEAIFVRRKTSPCQRNLALKIQLIMKKS